MTPQDLEVAAQAPMKLTREVQGRIRRRANTLSIIAYERYARMLELAIRSGAVTHTDIETWTPLAPAEAQSAASMESA